MKKLCAVLLIITLTFLFLFSADARENQYETNDPKLLSYMEGTVYESMISSLSDAGYFIENIDAVYISQEYLDKAAFNSQVNIYFGYNPEELNEQFQGTRYIFTLGEDHETTVLP